MLDEVYVVYIEDRYDGDIIEFFDAYPTVHEATKFVCYEAGRRSELLDWVSSREARVSADRTAYKIRLFKLHSN